MRCPFLPPTSPEDECKLFTVQLAAVNVRASRVLSANCPKEWEKQKFRNCVQSWSTLVFLQISHILYPMKNFSQQDIPALLPYVQMKYVRSRYAIHSRGDKIPIRDQCDFGDVLVLRVFVCVLRSFMCVARFHSFSRQSFLSSVRNLTSPRQRAFTLGLF